MQFCLFGREITISLSVADVRQTVYCIMGEWPDGQQLYYRLGDVCKADTWSQFRYGACHYRWKGARRQLKLLRRLMDNDKVKLSIQEAVPLPPCVRCGKPIMGRAYYSVQGAECEECFHLPPETYIPKNPCIKKRSIKERYKKIAESKEFKDAYEGKSLGEVMKIEE